LTDFLDVVDGGKSMVWDFGLRLMEKNGIARLD
jgi:hypothetical protein